MTKEQNAYMAILKSYHLGIFERLWLSIESRSFDKHTEQIIALTPVMIFMQKERIAEILSTLENVLQMYLKPHLLTRACRHILLRLKEYAKNEQSFLEARDLCFDCLCQNIQLYALVLDLSKPDSEHLTLVEQVISKRFDKEYQLNAENLRLLENQEKYYTE